MGRLAHIEVDLDGGLVEKVMALYQVATPSEAVDLALRRLADADPRDLIRELQGSGWEGDLDAMRGGDPIEEI